MSHRPLSVAIFIWIINKWHLRRFPIISTDVPRYSCTTKHDTSGTVIPYRAFQTPDSVSALFRYSEAAQQLSIPLRRLADCPPETVKHQSKTAVDVNAPRSHMETVTLGNIKERVARVNLGTRLSISAYLVKILIFKKFLYLCYLLG